jgi:hypothetical protein
MRRLPSAGAALGLAAALAAGCLEVPSDGQPMCRATSDCDAGEVCDEGICWGNPPSATFAAVLTPPSPRTTELVSREVTALSIAPDGWIEELLIPHGVSFKGRLQPRCEAPLACDGRRFGATITVTRPAAFRGGPGFRRVLTVDAADETFEITAPASTADRVVTHYLLTVVPDERDAPVQGPSAAELVPPLRYRLPLVTSSSGNVIELGGLELPRVTGTITSSTGVPLAGYRVVALGRWAVSPDQPPTEVSTVDFTGPDGKYGIVLSRDLVDAVEIVARPLGTEPRPELHLAGVDATADSAGRVLALPTPQVGSAAVAEVIVTHPKAGGEVTRVAGARVVISASAPTGTGASARYAVEATTDSNGSVRLPLLSSGPLAQRYRLSIIPPANSPAAALFEKPYALQPQIVQQLGTRLAIAGRVRAADGAALAEVSVTARPALRFLWSLDPALQGFVGEIPAATAVTPNSGEFVVFVDHAFTSGSGPSAGTVWGHYDLAFEPSAKARVPALTRVAVELPRDATAAAVSAGEVELPDGAHVRALVIDDQGQRLESAEIKLYRAATDTSLCLETRHEPATCPIPAELVGRGATDDRGVLRMTLPR